MPEGFGRQNKPMRGGLSRSKTRSVFGLNFPSNSQKGFINKLEGIYDHASRTYDELVDDVERVYQEAAKKAKDSSIEYALRLLESLSESDSASSVRQHIEWAADSESVEWVVRKILSVTPSKFTEYFEHYLGETGTEKKLDPVPLEWQALIKNNWQKPQSQVRGVKFPEKNKYRISPYLWGNFDLRNAIGHFNLIVTDEEYIIEDLYRYYYLTDEGEYVRHGPCITKNEATGKRLKFIAEKLLPDTEYIKEGEKGAKKEKFCIVRERDGGYYFYLPTGWLLDRGRPFPISGRFKK